MKITFKRIARRGFIISGHSLWLNSDFMLSVSGGMFSEDYKRFYFQDIQSIIFHKTDAWKIWNWVLGCLAALSMTLLMIMSGGRGILFIGLAAALISAALAVNISFGPSCVCYIATAVQMEKLIPLNRLKIAKRTVETLRPLIIQAQRNTSPNGRRKPNL